MKNSVEADYLERYKVDDKKYLIGVYEPTITFYKQQIRATNIFYCLLKTGKLKKNTEIAVVGGGAAGLTFTALALKCGIKVHLYEKASSFLNMQIKCNHRILHPNVYDWPVDSLQNEASLPVLSWRADTAANVAKQVMIQFDKIKEEHADLYDEKLETEVDNISLAPTGNVLMIKSTDRSAGQTTTSVTHYKLVVVAAGFGVEYGVAEAATPSYWRYDFETEDLHKTKEVEISGTGDGALADLFRAKIRKFDILTAYKQISTDPNYKKILQIAKNLKREWTRNREKLSKTHNGAWLYEMFRAKLDKATVSRLFKTLGVDTDRKVNLSGLHQEFNLALNLDGISFINALIAYVLFEGGAVSYKHGTCKLVEDVKTRTHHYKVNNKKKMPPFFARHGTNVESGLAPFFSDAERKELKTRQQAVYHAPLTKIYDDGYLVSRFISGINKVTESNGQKDLCTHCSIFVSTLARTISTLVEISEDDDFRLALHRTVRLDGKDYFQQITPYFGNNRSHVGRNSVGKYFDSSIGNVGLSAKSGLPLLFVEKSKKEFDELAIFMGLNPSIIQKKKIYLSIPIFGNHGGRIATNLVLFLDSTTNIFTKNKNLINVIVSSLQGFIDAIENLLKSNDLRMNSLDFDPTEIDLDYGDAFFATFAHNSCVDMQAFKGIEPLTFQGFYSFNTKYL